MTPKCPDCKRDQDDCICASPASAPKGWKIVPVEPTEEMIKLGAHVLSEWLDDAAPLHERRYVNPFIGTYKHVLAAAPTPPVSEDRKDAERYRWLRDIGNNTWEPMIKRGTTATQCDSAIDAEIAATQEDKS